MQNTVRWRSDQLDGAVWGVFGNTLSNKSDANVEGSDCSVKMLLFLNFLYSFPPNFFACACLQNYGKKHAIP